MREPERRHAPARSSPEMRGEEVTDNFAQAGDVAAAVERLHARGVTDEEIRRLFEAELAGLTKPGGHGA